MRRAPRVDRDATVSRDPVGRPKHPSAACGQTACGQTACGQTVSPPRVAAGLGDEGVSYALKVEPGPRAPSGGGACRLRTAPAHKDTLGTRPDAPPSRTCRWWRKCWWAGCRPTSSRLTRSSTRARALRGVRPRSRARALLGVREGGRVFPRERRFSKRPCAVQVEVGGGLLACRGDPDARGARQDKGQRGL